jgi:hypothetical protein
MFEAHRRLQQDTKMSVHALNVYSIMPSWRPEHPQSTSCAVSAVDLSTTVPRFHVCCIGMNCGWEDEKDKQIRTERIDKTELF